MNTLSKETSKLIHALGIEVVTEKWWVCVKEGEEVCFPCDEFYYQHLLSEQRDVEKICPAYSLSELFQSLEAIGEKLGWEKEEPLFIVYEKKAHTILDHFLNGGMSAVDKYIGELLK